MMLYNIRKEKYADRLIASGVANRWNKKDEYVIYTGSSISLCTLELLAHRAAIDIATDYKLLFIEAEVCEQDIETVKVEGLPAHWASIISYPILQKIGSEWYQKCEKLLLEVPSALVQWEKNYLINTKHPEFEEKIKIVNTENFPWDRRLL
ncbi:RES family NAD+ phosphorylase [Leadbetterella byssophila]|uniref:RES domain protein n=1 Tax=Leadbetterella byssophila (strain DSM 17132 / JCM 16389 / KACC 11308 / NBRC 106382 / 4M15) TaxID=649349 RepID=E4RZE3_LEAB4|nr:RES family NAD+ phosphorylase [Leadbetterella byssophila]ADQ16482.1 RES domain protein [Leadbetterella byssophila DSM 17132]